MARSPPWRRAAALRLNHRTPAHTAAQGGGHKLCVCAGTAQNMFQSARAFNQPLAAWDVGQVTDMQVCRCPAFGSGARAHTQLLRGAATSRVRVLARRSLCSIERALSTSLWKLGTSARSTLCRCAVPLPQGHRAPAHTQLLTGVAASRVRVLAWRSLCSMERALSTSLWKLGTSARFPPCMCAAALRQGHRAPAHTRRSGGHKPCACAGAAQGMFQTANSFNQPVEAWDVSQVTCMWVRRRPASGSQGSGANTAAQ